MSLREGRKQEETLDKCQAEDNMSTDKEGQILPFRLWVHSREREERSSVAADLSQGHSLTLGLRRFPVAVGALSGIEKHIVNAL